MEVKIYFAVLAGGVGSRMESGVPKQFLNIGGREMLLRSVDAFLPFAGRGSLFVTSPLSHFDITRTLLEQSYGDLVTLVPGGVDRNGSIENVINEIRKTDRSESSFIVTHDAARPFVSPEIIRGCVELCMEGKANAVALPVTDTIAVVRDGEYVSIPRRSEMYACQTPQCFPVSWFEQAYAALPPEERAVQTDACAMLLRAGRRVYAVGGESTNLKLTSPFDMTVADAIINRKES